MSGKTSVSRRMLILNVVIAVAFMALLAVFIKVKSEPIAFADGERMGIAYQTPLQDLLFKISSHRILSARAAAGEEAALEETTRLAQSIDDSWKALVAVDSQLGDALQFTEAGLKQRQRESSRLPLVQARWNELRSAKPTLTGEAHQQIIGDLRALIAHAGDTSNLILDSDLDSYYLMDVTLVVVPQAQDRIQAALLALTPLLREKSTEAVRASAAVIAASMREGDLARIQGDIKTSVNEDQNFYGELPGYRQKITQATERFDAAYGQLVALCEKMSKGDKLLTAAEFEAVGTKALNESAEYWTTAAHQLDDLLAARMDSNETMRLQTTLVSILVLILVTLAMYAVNRSISAQLKSIATQLTGEAKELEMQSGKLSLSSQALSDSAVKQASSVQQQAASLEEISSMVKRTAESARTSLDVAERSSEAANLGIEVVRTMSMAIEDISTSQNSFIVQMESGNDKLENIVKLIREIGEKTQVINEIVFQTKLLSFNASVEAARAGEQGKGFAVVAEEVGNLAQMSGNAARSINDLLKASVERVSAMVAETKQNLTQTASINKARVAKGIEVCKQCGDVFSEMSSAQRQVVELVGAISVASQEQSQGVSEINAAVNSLDQSTSENSTVASETAASAEQISQRVIRLNENIVHLQSLVGNDKKVA